MNRYSIFRVPEARPRENRDGDDEGTLTRREKRVSRISTKRRTRIAVRLHPYRFRRRNPEGTDLPSKENEGAARKRCTTVTPTEHE